MDIEDLVAVVGHDPLALDRVSAEPHQLAGDVGARHRDHFDRQREAAEHVGTSLESSTMHTKRRDAAATIFSRVSARAAALDESQLRIGLVGAVDVQVEVADGVQIQDFDAVLLQARAWRLSELDTAPSNAQLCAQPAHR